MRGCKFASRTEGLLEEVMSAGSQLELGSEPVLALAFAAMLLAYARDRAEQGALASKGCLSVLAQLLQVRAFLHHMPAPLSSVLLASPAPNAHDANVN